jgi:hypothetical protein
LGEIGSLSPSHHRKDRDMSHRLPPTASVTEDAGNGRLIMPAAERNKDAIATLVAQLLEDRTEGQALELASGAGQHIVEHARRNPQIDWQPSEPNAEHRASIDLHISDSGLTNIRSAIPLDATAPGWSATHVGQHLILLSNLLHLISTDETETLIREAGAALAPGGQLMLYGPFMRGGDLTSDGDRRFHAELTGANPKIGYKDDFDITDMIHASGMELTALIEMPANNLAFVARRFG